MYTELENLQITNGPAIDALFDACKYAYGKNGQTATIPIHFDIATRTGKVIQISKISISSIGHEDGTGKKFNLTGFCSVDTAPVSVTGTHKVEPFRFRAYYNTNDRKGWMEFIE